VENNEIAESGKKRCVVLISGSGRSTIMTSLIRSINDNQNCHIIMREDRISNIDLVKNSIIQQRDVSSTCDYLLRKAHRGKQ